VPGDCGNFSGVRAGAVKTASAARHQAPCNRAYYTLPFPLIPGSSPGRGGSGRGGTVTEKVRLKAAWYKSLRLADSRFSPTGGYAIREQASVRSAAHKFEQYLNIRATPAIVAYFAIDAVDAGMDRLPAG
jgi:hypothetical protein